MRKKDTIFNVKNVIKELEFKKNYFFYHRIKKYIVDYYIEGEYLIVKSNLGITRKVKKNKSNMNRLNKTIVKNKIAIANQIDEYERNSYDRSILILVNILILCGCGSIVPITLFMGSYIVFLLSIILFSLSVMVTSLIGVDYYIKIKEIQNLKEITGYKLENGFVLSQTELTKLKNRKFKDAN